VHVRLNAQIGFGPPLPWFEQLSQLICGARQSPAVGQQNELASITLGETRRCDLLS
jgi:hypothetical protein